jgi:hypothetical protein
MMKKMKIILAALGCLCLMGSAIAENMQNEIAANPMDCSNMSMDMQQFAAQLNTMNKKMFCGQFNASQRSTAMQYAAQQDSNGNNMMSADQAVQKVAADNNMKPAQKTPTGCPVK